MSIFYVSNINFFFNNTIFFTGACLGLKKKKKDFKRVFFNFHNTRIIENMARELWLTHPRTFGPGSRTCRKCGNHHGIIRKYGLNMCRRCFRTDAEAIGFNKYR
ncbi:hypothetical protein RB653_010151 [Dictyostelium firmibasis]|uniref:40S ribosomal protein S29 n=1 Tax=Dictyostelium firmibasis TaxID=79012 RepID=A0AAN7YTG6_9MYCE